MKNRNYSRSRRDAGSKATFKFTLFTDGTSSREKVVVTDKKQKATPPEAGWIPASVFIGSTRLSRSEMESKGYIVQSRYA